MLWFVLFFSVAAFGATEWWSRALLEFFIFVLAAMCVLRGDFAPSTGRALLGFAIIIGIGVLQALNLRPLSGPSGLFPFTAARPQTLYALLLWIGLATFFWSACGILLWQGALRRLALAVFVIGLFIAIVGMLQRGQGNIAYYGLRPILSGTNPFGPFTDYDHAANWLAAAALVGAGLFAERIQIRGRIALADRIAQLMLMAFILCVSVAAILETGSRGALNAFLASTFTTLFLAAGSLRRARARYSIRAILVVLCCFYALFLYSHPKWLGFVGGVLSASAAYRVSMYRSGLRILADFPVFGIGLGGLQNAFHPYQERLIIGLVDHIHNSWLEIVLEAGLFGAIPALTFIFQPLAVLGRRIARANLAAPALHTGCFAATLAVVFHGFLEFNFQIPANAALFCVLLAAVSVSILVPPIQPKPVVWARQLILAAAFIVLALMSLPPGVSGYRLRLGGPFLANGEQHLIDHPFSVVPAKI